MFNARSKIIKKDDVSSPENRVEML